MITLYTFGPHFGLPDASPFVMKTDVLLKMSGLPYRTNTRGFRRAPKGKLPYIDDNGKVITDSTFIRLHLEQTYSIEFDKQLSPSDKAIGWAIEKMLEDNLYWALVHARWLIDGNFIKGPAQLFASVPILFRSMVKKLVRRDLRKRLHGHGIGRHSAEEIIALANRTIDAIATILGDKPYLLGPQRCGTDATAFAFVAGILCPHFETPIRIHAEQYANLVAYRDRLMQEFYPAIVQATL